MSDLPPVYQQMCTSRTVQVPRRHLARFSLRYVIPCIGAMLTAYPLTSGRAQGTPSTARSASILTQRLDSALRTLVADGAPGCVVGARLGAARVIVARGVAELERGALLDSLSIMEAGSVAKQFTAGVLVKLAQQQRVNLDEPVRRWIPELQSSQPAMTVRQLLTHQAGLAEWGDLVAMQGWPRGTANHRQAAIVSLIARLPRTNFKPGAEYLYSNSNYIIAAEVAARAGGASFDSVSQRVLFSSLGLQHTSWRTDFRLPVPGRARAFTTNDAGAWQLDTPIEDVVGHGGLLTTIPDMLAWLDSLDAAGASSDAFRQEMERVGVLTSGRNTAYALGLEVATWDGLRVVSHAGATAGYRAYAGRIPARRASIAVLCNNGDVNTEELGPLLLALVADLLPPTVRQPQFGEPMSKEIRGAMAGRFRNARTRALVTVRSFSDGLTLNTWVGFRAVDGADGTRFVSEDGARRLQMAPDARWFMIIAAGNTGSNANAAADTLRYERVDAWQPSIVERQTIAGRYHDETTGATWTLIADGDGMRVFPRLGASQQLQPLYRDAFRSVDDGFTITVERDARGRLAALAVWSLRSRNLRLERMP